MGRVKHKQKASFAGIPRLVMECPDYTNLSGNAIRLLVELAYSYKGGNTLAPYAAVFLLFAVLLIIGLALYFFCQDNTD